jgi:uncharacterized SAM-binding protein YcdF (DUF218 family)
VLLVLVLAVTAVRVVQAGRTDEARTADVILVLGAAQFDGRPQEYLTARLEHARSLYASGTSKRVLTLGGKQPGDRFTEGEAGQSYLVGHGVPADSILPVGKGNDTRHSIAAAADVMRQRGWTSAVVVTDPWHELRSTAMLRAEGMTAYGSPTRTGPSVAGPAVKVRYVARETVAYLAYELGRVLP